MRTPLKGQETASSWRKLCKWGLVSWRSKVSPLHPDNPPALTSQPCFFLLRKQSWVTSHHCVLLNHCLACSPPLLSGERNQGKRVFLISATAAVCSRIWQPQTTVWIRFFSSLFNEQPSVLTSKTQSVEMAYLQDLCKEPGPHLLQTQEFGAEHITIWNFKSGRDGSFLFSTTASRLLTFPGTPSSPSKRSCELWKAIGQPFLSLDPGEEMTQWE